MPISDDPKFPRRQNIPMGEGHNDTAYKKACGERLQQVRIALDFDKRRAFAAALPADVSEDRLEKWENGNSLIPPRYARYIKRRWGIPTDWIYDGDISGMPGAIQEKLLKLFPDIAI